MRNFTGYFLLGSKLGGLTRKPSTLSLCAPVNQKGSSGDMATSDRSELLMCESWRAFGCGHCGGHPLDLPASIALIFSRPNAQAPGPGSATKISVGDWTDIRVKARAFKEKLPVAAAGSTTATRSSL